jgi:hypothetical protein
MTIVYDLKGFILSFTERYRLSVCTINCGHNNKARRQIIDHYTTPGEDLHPLRFEDLTIDYKALKTYILSHQTPRQVIKIFIVEIMKKTYGEEQVDKLLDELKTNGKFIGH